MPAKPRVPKPSVLMFLTVAMGSVAALGLYAGSLVDGRLGSWLIRTIVWAIGSLVVFLVYRLLRAFSPAESTASEPDALDEQLSHARKALAAAGAKGRGAIGKLPVVTVLGRSGSAKTSFVLRSGLDPEHLAGNLYEGSAVAPTEALNLWFHDGMLVVEAAGGVLQDGSRWKQFVKKIRPSRLRAALLRQPQAARVAVVCFDVAELLQPGGEEAVLAAAAELRGRLSELSESIGIRLPVYVVFTRSDQIPFFTEFAEHLSEQEAAELLGATLRAPGEMPASAYKERESQRLQEALDDLYQSLAERRLSVLSRTGDQAKITKAYEFPREFRKISARAKQFLVELGRPNQLRVSPFLRGFFFTGVRPVLVTEDAPPQAVSPISGGAPAGATQIFNVQQLRQAMAAPTPSSQRRVPQAVFLRGILRRVVLADRVAMGITAGGFGLNALRRASLMMALVGVLMLGIGVVVGQARDRALRADVADAIRGVEALGSDEMILASQEDLEALEALRVQTERLSRYEHDGRPWRRFLWLYSGSSLYPTTSSVYFDRFENLLLGRARQAITRRLQSLPDEDDPTLDERDEVYDALKAYIEMSDRTDRATPEFFARAFWEFWASGSVPAERVGELARLQFDFYGSELQQGIGDPYGTPADPLTVAEARGFLARTTTSESFYQGILAQANGAYPSFSLNRDHPGTDLYIINTFEVPGAYTRPGWNDVHRTLSDARSYFTRDEHVVGSEFLTNIDVANLDSLGGVLRERYEREYVERWSRYLAASQFVAPTLDQAQGRLGAYASNQSALLTMLEAIEQNTLFAPVLESIFQPVRTITGADSLPGRFSAEGEQYLNRVQAMASAVGNLAQAPGDDGAMSTVRQAATDGTDLVTTLGRAFPTAPAEAQAIGQSVSSLLREPFDWGTAQAQRGPVVAANRLAREFCTGPQTAVLRDFPFRSGGGAASWEEVHNLFRDGGAIDRFLEEAEQYSGLNTAFTNFRNRAGAIRRSLYQDIGIDVGDVPRLRINVAFDTRDEIVMSVDGSTARFSSGTRTSQTLPWIADRARQVTLTVSSPGRPQPREYSGTWGIFEFFYQGDWVATGQGSAQVTWRLSDGSTVTAQVRYTGEPILDRGYFASFSCPTSIAR